MKIQDQATTISNGVSLNVSSTKILGISIYGTATSFQIDFYASLNNGGDFYPVAGRRADDGEYNYVSSTTTKDKIYIFDVGTYTQFQARISVISGGYLTVEASEER